MLPDDGDDVRGLGFVTMYSAWAAVKDISNQLS